jgi:hypothetical protein
MTLSERFQEIVRAGFAGVYVVTHEPDEAIASLAQQANQHSWAFAVWDVDAGLQCSGSPATAVDPLSAVRAAGAMAKPEKTAVLVLRNFHRFLSGVDVVQAVERQLARGKSEGVVLVVLAPVVQLPVELERPFLVLDHELPSAGELRAIAEGLDNRVGAQSDESLDRLVEAASGLTRTEAENAFALSLVRKDRFDPEVVWEIKAQTLAKGGAVQLHRGGDAFRNLGGLYGLKNFCSRLLAKRDAKSEKPKGVLLLGVPGTGKSAFAKSLGNETGRPVLSLDVGALMGSLVGQTEQNVRRALKTIDAMAPCVCFVDEIEKGLAGAQGGQGDSGVAARLFGTLLTWLSDHESDVFFVATSNDVSRLPPEFARAERFDALFFLDLPGRQQKDDVWGMYGHAFGVDVTKKPDDDRWTPAEIRACCRLASLLGLSVKHAAKHIVPVASTGTESVAKLRQWASGRCLDAETGEVFRIQPTTTRRRPPPDPSNN